MESRELDSVGSEYDQQYEMSLFIKGQRSTWSQGLYRY